jgi:hypothetical protein
MPGWYSRNRKVFKCPEKKKRFIGIVADGVFYVGLLMVLVISMSFTESLAGRIATCLN